ncbi:hypothetical protein FRB96_000069 [Tulasnella sp. 330]|nr:hypothetical protein FRB96_000069 [Tulasnella sp. 330]KAG8884074.1 hypothetical protein FRB97_005296 [Tulasnella sp. 331]
MFASTLLSAFTAILFLATTALSAPIAASTPDLTTVSGKMTAIGSLITTAQTNIETSHSALGAIPDGNAIYGYVSNIQSELKVLSDGVVAVCNGQGPLNLQVKATTPAGTVLTAADVAMLLGTLLLFIVKTVCDLVSLVSGVLSEILPVVTEIGNIVSEIIMALDGVVPGIEKLIAPIIAPLLEIITTIPVRALLGAAVLSTSS